MSLHFHALARWRIRRLYQARFSGDSRKLLAAIRACPSCSAYYNRLDRAEGFLCSPPAHAQALEEISDTAAASGICLLSHQQFVIERLESAVLRRALPEDRHAPRLDWRLAPAAAVAALASVLVLRPPETSQRVRLSPSDRFAAVDLLARGASTPEAEAVGIRVLRVVPGSAAPGIAEPSALGTDDLITLVYTNFDPKKRYLALFGVQADGHIRWYYPDSSTAQSISIASPTVDEPLHDGIRLSVNHHPGWLRVTGVFSERPLEKRQVEDAIASLAKKPGALENLEPLPLEKVQFWESSLRVELSDAP